MPKNSTRTPQELEHSKWLKQLDADYDKGIAEVVNAAAKAGKDVKHEDVSKKLKEVYSIAWNRYAKKAGLDGMILDTDCSMNSGLRKALDIFKGIDQKTRDAVKEVLTEMKSKKEHDPKYITDAGDIFKKLDGFIKNKKDRSFSKEVCMKVFMDESKGGYFSAAKSDYDKLTDETKSILNALDVLYGIELNVSDERAMMVFNSLSNVSEIVESWALNIRDTVKSDDFKDDMENNKKALVHQCRVKALMLTTITVAASLVAAVLLSEVLVGVAVGGAAGVAISTFVTTQAPAVLALTGFALPAATAQTAIGAVVAAGAGAGLLGIAANLGFSQDNKALMAAIGGDRDLNTAKNSTTRTLVELTDMISKSREPGRSV